MAIHEAIVYEGQKVPADVIARLEKAKDFPINFDDAPPLTEEQLARGAAIARAKRATHKAESTSHFRKVPNSDTIEAINEGWRIAHNPNAKSYDSVEEWRTDLGI